MNHAFTRHAREKMRSLRLRTEDIDAVIRRREVVERFPERSGHLLYGWARGKEVHVVLVESKTGVTLVTTLYEVDRRVFPDGRTRRSAP